MNDIIEQIKNLIISEYKNKEKEQGTVTRDFFDDEHLKLHCKDSLIAIFKLFFGGEEYNLTDEQFNEKYIIALKDVKYNYSTVMNPSISIRNEYEDSWLTPDRIKKIGWDNDEIRTYRARYLKYLASIGRSKDIIEETGRSSLEIIKKIGDPQQPENYFVKGLVVGSVQSGKTSNFNAVINSAIDVGYKLIIVLSGIMEDLRRQTQIRTEKEVEGKMIEAGQFDGVGKIASFGVNGRYPDVNQIVIPTSRDKDFNRNVKEADFSLNHVNVLICKKNTSVLQNLLLWLRIYLKENGDKQNITYIPFLIIDDEADNASLNNLGYKGKEYANKINGHIRALLALFNRKTYIGYTATPFANVLQDWNMTPDKKWEITDPKTKENLEFEQEGNLFPDDFIELLIPPSNYIGAKHFFETRIENVRKIETLHAAPVTDHIRTFPERIHRISGEGVKRYSNKAEFDKDSEAINNFGTYSDYRQNTRCSTKSDNFPVEIPRSLDEAIKCFIISIAVRLARKSEAVNSQYYQRHHTMLIHISRFSDWQCRTKRLITDKIDALTKNLNNDDLISEGSIYREFERIWNKYFEYTINNIKSYLPNNYEDEYLTKKSFEEIKKYLVKAIENVEIRAVNTVEKDTLDYESNDKKYIVIGGNKLSRGFTLEGLTINYFIRNTNYADTLMQMGRWFGYRPGYLDCCKLFTTQDSFDKFDLVTWTMEELEEEFRVLSKHKKKPIDYATKVLTHPGALQITRPSILKNAVVEKWSFEDKLIQTTELKITKTTIDVSWFQLKAVYNKYSAHFEYDKKNRGLVLKTDVEGFSDFIHSQITYTENFPKEAILRFVNLCVKENKLTNWTIVIKTSGSSKQFIKQKDSGFAADVTLTMRNSPRNPQSPYYFKLLNNDIFKVSGSSSNILSGGRNMSFTLSEEQIEKAEKEFRRDSPGKTIPERVYREKMNDSEGLMVIFLMDLKAVFSSTELMGKAIAKGIDINKPLVGFALGIPPFKTTLGNEYLLNRQIVELIRNNSKDDFEEEDIEYEDEYEAIISEL